MHPPYVYWVPTGFPGHPQRVPYQVLPVGVQLLSPPACWKKVPFEGMIPGTFLLEPIYGE